MNTNIPPFQPSSRRLEPSAQPFLPSAARPTEEIAAATSTLQPQARAFVPPPSCSSAQVSNFSTLSLNAPICRFFSKGACKKGLNCPFRHESSPEADGSEARAEEPPTMEYDVEDGIHCCFGPGASIIRLDLSEGEAEEDTTTSIVISGMPLGVVSEHDVESRLSAYGTVIQLTPKSAANDRALWYASATFSKAGEAADAVQALNGSTPQSWIGVGGVRPRTSRLPRSDTSLLKTGIISITLNTKKRRHTAATSVSIKVQWYAPSSCAWIHYAQRYEAEKAAARINNQNICGRVVSAKFQQPSSRQRTSFSVWISNLPGKVKRSEIKSSAEGKARFRSTSISVENNASYDERSGPVIAQKLLRQFGPLTNFDVQLPPPGSSTLKRRALARFANALDAKKACDHFERTTKIAELGGGRLFVQRIFSLKYSLPRIVFLGVKDQLHYTCASVQTTRLKLYENRDSWSVLVHADTQMAIDEVKSKLNQIVVGEVVRDPKNGNRALWSRHMLSPNYQNTLVRLTTGGVSTAWADPRRQDLRVFGPETERTRLKKAILQHHAESMLETHAVPIAIQEFEFILKEGRSAIDKTVLASGAKIVSLDIKNKSLLVVGEAREARKAQSYISKLASGSLKKPAEDDEQICPVCFCPPEVNAVCLSCDDIYCRDCFDAWLSSAGLRNYPLVCLDEGCGQRLSLWDLRKNLPGDRYLNILRFAVDDHVRKHPQQFQFCVSPTCPGIYELQEGERISTCSTCSLDICTECKESHGTSSCEEYRRSKLPPDRLRMKVVDDILTLRCPRCQQAFLDFTGCFALRCSVCPCGFCGWCLKDCGGDAHPHVLNECQSKPKGDRSYFGTKEQFESAQNVSRERQLTAFLSTLSAEERKACVASFERDLADLGLEV